MLAENVPESRAQIGEHPAQACPIAETRREYFCFAHQIQRIAVSTERDQRDAKIEPEVDGLGQGLRTLWNTREGAQRFLEPPGRGLVRGLRVGLAASLPQVGCRLAPRLGAEGVAGEAFGIDGGPVGGHRLQHFEDSQVEGPPALVKQTRVGDIVGEGVHELVSGAREARGLVQELGRAKPGQARAQGVVADIGDCLEQSVRDVLTDDGSCLEQALVIGRQTVDPRGQHRLHAGRHMQRLDGPGPPMGAGLAHEFLRLAERADALLEEERVPAGGSDQELPEGLERGIGSDERIQQFGHMVLWQRLQQKLGVVSDASPAVLI